VPDKKKRINLYPFGLKHKGYNNVTSSNGNSVANKFKYNGKEYEKSLGLNVTEMDFRQYDNALGRFYNPDRLAELAPSITPYRFGFNNPIYFNDPSGLWENTSSGVTTSDSRDIRRFMDMLEIEQETNGGASKAQINKFVKEEGQGSRGRLSDGSALLDGVTVKRGNNLSGRQVAKISSQIEQFVDNPYNEKSFGFGNYWNGKGHWSRSYRYYRERSNKGFPLTTTASLMLSEAKSLMHNKKTWMGKNFKFYSTKWGGNGATGGKNKFAKNNANRIGMAGNALSIYGSYNLVRDYQNGQLSTMGAIYLGTNDAAGYTPNPILGAMSLGTGLGDTMVGSDWYFSTFDDDYNW
jgi:RHS repeat-associated protein